MTHGPHPPRHTGDVLSARLAHLVRAQPGVFGGAIVIALWFALNLPGLGQHGLWDPWEMDRAHVARQMTSPPRVMVVEARESGRDLGPIGRWLTLRYGESLVVTAPNTPRRKTRRSAAKELESASTALDADIAHLIVVDATLVVEDPASHAQVQQLIEWLARTRARNQGSTLLLVGPMGTPDQPSSWATELRRTATDVRVELAGQELTGRRWGKPGIFRRELVNAIQRGRKEGYAVFPPLEPSPSAGFLEEAFWRAAEKRKLDARMTRTVPSELAAELRSSAPFQLSERILPWPRDADYDAVLHDFANAEETAPAQASQAVADLEVAVDAVFWAPVTLAAFKHDGFTRSVPPLDYWLMALSFEQLGFSELASRLPAFVLGLLGLLLCFGFVSDVWGGLAASLAALVLCTSPLYFSQARSVAGEVSFTLSLMLVIAGLMGAIRGRAMLWSIVAVLAGGTAAFLSHGLFGLIVPTSIAVTYVLVAGDRRAAVLVPTLILVGSLAIAALVVTSAQGGSFWSHFALDGPLFSWKLDPAERPTRLTFDVLVRQLGFGFAPWSALLPFGLGLLGLRLARDRDRPSLLVLLWLLVPFAVQAATLKYHNHFVFPAAPAAAVAVALLLVEVLRGRRMGAVAGLCAAILVGVFLSNFGKTPEPLTTWLTTDPPLGGSETASSYPEDLKLPRPLELALLAVAGLLLLHGARLATRGRLVVSFLARTRPFAVALTFALTALSVLLLAGLEVQIAAGFNTRSGQLLETIHRLYVRGVFYWRPDGWALITVLGASALALITFHTPIARQAFGWLRRWVLTPFVARWLAVVLGGAALAAAAAAHSDPVGAIGDHGMPGVWLVLAGLALALGLSVLPVRVRPFGGWVVGGLISVVGLGLAALSVRGAAPAPEVAAATVPLIVSALALTVLPFVLGLLRRVPGVHPLAALRRLAALARSVPAAAFFAAGLGLAAVVDVLVLAGPPGGALTDATLRSLAFWLFAVAGVHAVWASRARLETALVVGGAILASVALHLLLLTDAVGAIGGTAGGLGGLLVGAAGVLVAFLFAANVASPRLSRGSRAFYRLHIVLVAGALLLGIDLLILLGRYPAEPGWFEWATTDSPVHIAGALALAAWGAVVLGARQLGGVLFADDSLLRSLRRAREPAVATIGVMIITGWWLSGLLVQLLVESGMSMVEFVQVPEAGRPAAVLARNRGYAIGGLVVVAALGGLNALWSGLRAHASVAWGALILSGTGLAATWIASLSRKWLHMEAAVQGDGAEPFLPYLFLKSRRTQAAYALVAVLVLIFLGRRAPAIARRLRTARATREVAVALGLALVVTVATALAGRVPWSAVTGVFVAAAAGAIGLLLNRSAMRIADVLARLRELRLATAATAFLLALAGAAIVGSGAVVGILAAPAIAFALSRTRLAAAADELRDTRGLLIRGVTRSIVAAAAFFVPLILAAPFIQDAPGVAAHGLLLLVVAVAIGSVLVLARIGLGIADVMARASILSPVAFAMAGAAILDLVLHAGPAVPGGVSLAALTGAILGLLVLFANLLARTIRPIRALELVERPSVFVPLLALAVAGFAFFYNHELVTALSFHVSQKHILETVSLAEGDAIEPDTLLQHGLGESGGSKRNFYTKEIPEVKDTTAALRALSGESDQVLALTRAGSSGVDYRIARGFAPENDPDGDGLRDWPADAGIARFADRSERWIEDPDKSWVPDQWKGSILTDSEGWSFPVAGNSATRVFYEPKATPPRPKKRKPRTSPAFDAFPSERNAYSLDHPDAVRRGATAMRSDRLYFLLPKVGDHAPAYSDKGSFSDLNHRFRRINDGRHLSVLDDRSSRILLAASALEPGESDRNWLKSATLSEADFSAMVARAQVRGAASKRPLEGILTFDTRIAVLGWSMDDYSVSKGRKLRIHIYFQAKKPVSSSYKIFLHLDRAGHRIHSDHWPLSLSEGEDRKHCIGCFQTDHWLPGDIVVDTFEREVPFGAPSGETDVWMGLFNPQGDKRMEISSWNDSIVRYTGNDNRARIGSFVVR